MPKFGSKVQFKNSHKRMHVPVVIYADFESILKPVADEKKEKFQEHWKEWEPILKRGDEMKAKDLQGV